MLLFQLLSSQQLLPIEGEGRAAVGARSSWNRRRRARRL